MQISLNISMPDKVQETNKYQSLQDKVNDYILCCESDDESSYHYQYLKALYTKLSNMNKIPIELLPVLECLEEFMLKYDTDRESLDAKDMFKYDTDEE